MEFDESHFLLNHVDDRVHVCYFPGEHLAPGCSMGRRQGRGSVMRQTILCSETSGSVRLIRQLDE